ncbi:MAG: SLBB domain-containing protein [Spirochaetaceae bacterium]|nr:SLBB domain-containing protein [Spirochaetaceae bacterium]
MNERSRISHFANSEAPLDIARYIESGGYVGLMAALGKTSAEVIGVVKNSGLRGRGGAGFPTGLKWESVAAGEQPYLVCNADEGEPGTFKDRFILERAPYLVLEGMTIAALAIGAREGYIYVRGEYPEIAKMLALATEKAKARGYLGNDILSSGFSFDVAVRVGGGSYVVGDETALLNSLMGNRGYPMLKPPFPTEKGLWGKPTVVNNVETLAYVPIILGLGAQAFASIGSVNCPGYKLFSLSGHVANPGVYEFPMGTRLRDVLEKAGGVTGTLKAIQIGGTAGPIFGPAALDYNLDFPSMQKAGGALGSGAIVAMNTSVNMAHVLEVTMRFFAQESCGQCFPCRYGTRQLDYMAHRIALGLGKVEYLDLMRETATVMVGASFCPFGQSVALPLKSLLDEFGDEIVSFMTEQQYLKEVSE